MAKHNEYCGHQPAMKYLLFINIKADLYMKKIIIKLILSSFIFSANALAAIEETKQFSQFVNKMVKEHQFNEAELKQLFKSVEIKKKIIKTMTRPAEGTMTWHQYRKIFLGEKRINEGVKFWKNNEETLGAVAEKYGVPAEIITAIIGVETSYGQRTGGHRVIDALSTLAFEYPKRSKFFTRELEHFLILCREQKMNPLEPTGSYAGAMGIPQFMPSSYRAYAADFENDGKSDIWNNPADAIASVANYFGIHKWQKGGDIAFLVNAEDERYQAVLSKGLKPDLNWAELQAKGITSEQTIEAEEKVKLLAFQQQNKKELWVGLNNFYTITRYNHSQLYAMAVYQLSREIYKQKQQLSKPI